MLFQWIGLILAIVVVDLALSGDNALVIGAAAARLPTQLRQRAIIFGGAFAIVLRIGLTLGATLLLRLPLLKAIGGIIVFIIAIQILQNSEDDVAETNAGWRKHLTGKTLLSASLIIILADVSMSLDNIWAIAALANGNSAIVIAGLLLSVLLLLLASSLLARLIARFPILIVAAGLILAWTAGTLLDTDATLAPLLKQIDAGIPGPDFGVLLPFVMTLLLLVIVGFIELRKRRLKRRSHHQFAAPSSKPR